MRPPALDGFEHVRLLGSGGYADVFLYEQQMPRREVAIKVLLAEGLGEKGRQQFHDEANAMASVSTHPYIVTVFHAALSDAGNPYLVMEYYPRQNFSVRARTEQMSVAEVLRTGIQVGSAVETAHRAGILHRDIKPANILTSAYNRPGLTDFGIATSATGLEEAEGMSIPWSPPEVVNGSAPGDATADVYSLAATIYTLLAGRSPFEVPGGSNRSLDLINRIESGDLRPTGRGDVPESLERVLRHGMSPRAVDRPGSAFELARMLQAVEQEQGWSPTPIEVSEDPADVRHRSEMDPDDEDGTRLKAPVVIDPYAPGPSVTGTSGDTVAARASTGTTPVAPVGDRTAARPSGSQTDHGLIAGVGVRPVGLSGYAAPRPVAPMPSSAASAGESVQLEPQSAPVHVADSAPSGAPPRTTARTALLVGAGLAALAVVLLGFGLLGLGDSGDDEPPRNPGGTGDTTITTPPEPPAPSESVQNVQVAPGGDVVSWEYDPDLLPGTTFQVTDANGGAILGEAPVGTTSLTLPRAATCVQVVATTKGQSPSRAEGGCIGSGG